MIELLRLILHIVTSLFKPRAKLAAEILVLRQQLNVLRRHVSKRPQLSNTDRFLFVWLYRWFPSVLSAIAILRPETIIRGGGTAAIRDAIQQTNATILAALEEVYNEHCERMQNRKHRPRSCGDSTRRCDSQADGIFGKDTARLSCSDRSG
jgi:hypothetical protein